MIIKITNIIIDNIIIKIIIYIKLIKYLCDNNLLLLILLLKRLDSLQLIIFTFLILILLVILGFDPEIFGVL